VTEPELPEHVARNRAYGRRSTQSGVEFYLGYGDWIRLLRASGFEVLDLIEIQAPDDLADLRGDGLVDPDWARKWPAEQIWRVCKMKPVR